MAESERIPVIVGVDKHVYYGVCNTPAGESTKRVVIQNPTLFEEVVENNTTYTLDLSVGDQLIVTFVNGNTSTAPTLSLHIDDSNEDISFPDNEGRIVFMSDAVNTDYDDYFNWDPGDIIPFIYTENASQFQSYWKFNMIKHATYDNYGTVRIANSLNDFEDPDDPEPNIAITLPVVKDLIVEDVDLEWVLSSPDLEEMEDSDEEEPLFTIELSPRETHDPPWVSSVSIPKSIIPNPEKIERTSQLINDADVADQEPITIKYLRNIDNFTIPNDSNGLGFFIDAENYLNSVEPHINNDGVIRIGYHPLYEYQDILDPTQLEYALNPELLLYGKDVVMGVDALEIDYETEKSLGKINFGRVDLPNNVFDPFADFGDDKINFYRDVDLNNNTLVADGLKANTLKLNGQDIIFPMGGTLAGNSFIKVTHVETPKLTAAAKSCFKSSGASTVHQKMPITPPNGEAGWRAMGIIGWNLDEAKNDQRADLVSIWEAFIDISGNNPTAAHPVLNYAAHSYWDKSQVITINFYILWVKENWNWTVGGTR